MAAVRGLDRTSPPGPNVLGPAFYQTAWPTVAGDVMRLFDGGFSSSVNLTCINRAHIVCKALTTRLQQQIPGIVRVD